MKYTPTADIAKKVLEVVDKGLVKGLGRQEPGKMCVEAAVCFAFGLPHGDNPPCVGDAVRSFKISLNDCPWPSDEARTKGMRKLAVAQLGSDTIDQEKFLELVGFKCISRILPVIIENALKEDSGKAFAPEDKELKAVIEKLKSVKDYEEAKTVAKEAWKVYRASASAYASASASFSAYASASAYAKKNPEFNLQVLLMTSQAGLEALQEIKSPGCAWLYLCE